MVFSSSKSWPFVLAVSGLGLAACANTAPPGVAVVPPAEAEAAARPVEEAVAPVADRWWIPSAGENAGVLQPNLEDNGGGGGGNGGGSDSWG